MDSQAMAELGFKFFFFLGGGGGGNLYITHNYAHHEYIVFDTNLKN